MVTAAPPAAERILPGPGPRFPPCDATASGSEDAVVRVARGLAVLFFCSHHYNELEFALAASGWRVAQDNREALP